MEELSQLAREYDLTYTIHLPLDLKLGAGGAETDRSASRALRVMEHVQPISPFAYVLHVEGMDGQGGNAWVDHTIHGLRKIEAEFPLDRVCVENLEGFPEAFWDPLFDQVSVSRCIDIGHLWVDRLAAVPYLQQRLQRTRVIHLHGIGTRDHQSLRHMPHGQVEEVLEYLIQHEYDGVVTLEMFSEEDVFGSTEMVREILEVNGWAG